MDVEEKKSLYKIIEGEQSNQKNSFKPYCFSDISVKNSSNNEKKDDKKKEFRRIEFREKGTCSPGWLEESPGNGDFTEAKDEKAKEIEEQAYIQGFNQGEKAGIESEKKKIEPVLHNFRLALLELEKIKKEIYMKAEQDTVELALAVAKKVVCHEVNTNREVILNIIKEAFRKVVDSEKVKIRINRSDLQFIRRAKSPLLSLEENLENVTFEEDETILNGGCIIETNFGDIDARIEQQLQIVEEAFKSELQKFEIRD